MRNEINEQRNVVWTQGVKARYMEEEGVREACKERWFIGVGKGSEHVVSFFLEI
jgi:hypothetical protein